MQVHYFTVIPVHADDHWDRRDELADRLWEAGCDDSNPGISCGRMRIGFYREGETFADAVRSAVAAVRSVGLVVDRVEIDRDDLALMLGETPVAERLRRGGPDPGPVAAAA